MLIQSGVKNLNLVDGRGGTGQKWGESDVKLPFGIELITLGECTTVV